MGPVRAAWGRGKVAWGGVGLSRVEYHGTDAQASLGRVGPVKAAWGRGKVAWGGVGLSRVEYHGTDAEASLTSGRRPSGVGGYSLYTHTYRALSLIQFNRGDPVDPERPGCCGAPAPARGCRARDAGHRQQLWRMPCEDTRKNNMLCRPLTRAS